MKINKCIALIGITLMYLSLSAFDQSGASIRGVVVDANNRSPLEFATVILYRQGENNPLDNQNSKTNGSFVFNNLTSGTYTLVVRLVGYDIATKDDILVGSSGEVDLGTIQLNALDYGLDEVTVVADKKQVIYKLDKQVVSASNNLLASGGTAVDILQNTPSIRVNAEGDVTFRGSSGFTVYINGKPSVLSGTQALEQIPASQIEDIEIITTPSAKYDTDGDVGMINIITMKNFGEGINGAINLTGSTLGSWGADFLINEQSGNNRWYINGNASQRRKESSFDQQKTTTVNDTTTYSHANGPRKSNSSSYYLKGGYEYNDKVNYFSIDLQGGYSKNERTGDMNYDETRSSGSYVSNKKYNSFDIYALDQNFVTTTMNLSRQLNDMGHEISTSFYLKYDWNALEYYESNMYGIPFTTFDDSRIDGSRAYEREHRWSLKANLDYTLPYSSTGKFETGYQYTWYVEDGRDKGDGYSIKFWDRFNKQFNWNEDLNVDYYFYFRALHSLYAIWSDKINRFDFQAGVRAENTHDILDIDIEQMNRNRTYFELFPSAHVAYTTRNNSVFTLAYAYRTNRPNIWTLEPYITYEDYYTAMIGNPDVKSEYTNALELNFRRAFGKSNSISATLFHRDRTGVREKIRVAYKPGVTLDSLSNVGRDKSSGLEVNSQIDINKWWNITANGSAYYYTLDVYDDAEISYGLKDDNAFNYEITLQNSFIATKKTRIQFDANLIGPSITSQGRQDPYYYFDISLRQQLLKDKVNVTVNYRNMFNTARYDKRLTSTALESITRIKPRYPEVTFTLSYAFNNYKLRDTKTDTSRDLFEGSSF